MHMFYRYTDSVGKKIRALDSWSDFSFAGHSDSTLAALIDRISGNNDLFFKTEELGFDVHFNLQLDYNPSVSSLRVRMR